MVGAMCGLLDSDTNSDKRPRTSVCVARAGRGGKARSLKKPKTFQDSPLYQILRHMYRVLDLDENKN
jgi:hypothetical protein